MIFPPCMKMVEQQFLIKSAIFVPEKFLNDLDAKAILRNDKP